MELLAFLILLLAIFAGFYMAWSIGANDVANSMSTAVGAKAITLRQAVLIAAILNFAGAVFVGKHVTDTIKGGIVNTAMIGDEHTVMLGFLAALLSAAIFVTLSTWKELPVSTTHAVIGGITGFGLIAGGTSVIAWKKLGEVASSWVLSPIAGAVIAFLVFRLIVHFVFSADKPEEATKKFGPFFIGMTFFIIFISLFTKTRIGDMFFNSMKEVLIVSLFIAFLAAITGFFLMKRMGGKGTEYEAVEFLFRRLQIMTSCYVAFSHGANDVANAIAPVTVVFTTLLGNVSWIGNLTYYLLAFGGIGIAIGILTWGYKVIRTLGSRITKLTNTRGFSVDFGAATTILVASKLGLPISTSHTVVGAIIGVGLARGLEAVDLRIIKNIIYSWMLTLPATVVTSILIYRGLTIVF
ncbi:MAG: phosphate permease [Chloroflexota bacterium]|nr:MAG: phosphate permease [Chloroflexota bacterium]RLF46026.1 MAG: phosphate permease [Thermoplasmata archaeon]